MDNYSHNHNLMHSMPGLNATTTTISNTQLINDYTMTINGIHIKWTIKRSHPFFYSLYTTFHKWIAQNAKLIIIKWTLWSKTNHTYERN